MQENGFIKNIFITPQPGKETNTIHILPNMSRSKGYQTMKFGLLIKHNMKNIFLEKSYRKYSGEAIPGPFSRNSKLRISLEQ